MPQRWPMSLPACPSIRQTRLPTTTISRLASTLRTSLASTARSTHFKLISGLFTAGTTAATSALSSTTTGAFQAWRKQSRLIVLLAREAIVARPWARAGAQCATSWSLVIKTLIHCGVRTCTSATCETSSRCTRSSFACTKMGPSRCFSWSSHRWNSQTFGTPPTRLTIRCSPSRSRAWRTRRNRSLLSPCQSSAASTLNCPHTGLGGSPAVRMLFTSQRRTSHHTTRTLRAMSIDVSGVLVTTLTSPSSGRWATWSPTTSFRSYRWSLSPGHHPGLVSSLSCRASPLASSPSSPCPTWRALSPHSCRRSHTTRGSTSSLQTNDCL
mmetsp:Transcript_77649/g.227684  ORF Transcript_77649/g.227684 Transcript_77649/m.227684 type:complete len:326 (+) Transcript_77649:127-1104(+)